MGKGRREAGRGRVRGRERGREKVGKGGRKQTCRYVMCFIFCSTTSQGKSSDSNEIIAEMPFMQPVIIISLYL